MSDFMRTSFDDITVSQPSTRRDEKFIKRMKAIVVLLFAVLGAEILLYKAINPSVKNIEIEFSGLENYSEQDFAELFGSASGASWFKLDTNTIASRISTMGGIEYVEVEKHFPNKIAVKVRERETVAMVLVSDGSRTRSVHIDKNCVLFEMPRFKANNSIPIVSGLPIEFIADGMRINEKYRTLIEQIREIQESEEKYFAAVSEICVLPKERGHYELMIIPVNSISRVLTGRALSEKDFQRMMVALDVVNSLSPDAAKLIDIRYGGKTVSIRPLGLSETL